MSKRATTWYIYTNKERFVYLKILDSSNVILFDPSTIQYEANTLDRMTKEGFVPNGQPDDYDQVRLDTLMSYLPIKKQS